MERYYSSTAVTAQLSAGIDAAATTMSVNTTTGYPANVPFTAGIDVDTELEELVNVTAVSGNTFTIERGYAGTSALDHETGAKVRHMMSHIDFQESRSHEESVGGVHGLSATDVVAGVRGVQTLENKTMDAVAGSNTFLNIPQSSVVGLPEIQTDVNDHEGRITVNEDVIDRAIVAASVPTAPPDTDPYTAFPRGQSIWDVSGAEGYPLGIGTLITWQYGDSRTEQILFGANQQALYQRGWYQGSWGTWQRLLTDADSLRPAKAQNGATVSGTNNGEFGFSPPAVGCTFVAPPSGRAMYQTFTRFNVNGHPDPQQNWRFTGEIRSGTSTAGSLIDPPSNELVGAYEYTNANDAANQDRSVVSPWLEVAGLTPGDTYTAWWKIQNSLGGTQTIDLFFRQVVVFPLI